MNVKLLGIPRSSLYYFCSRYQCFFSSHKYIHSYLHVIISVEICLSIWTLISIHVDEDKEVSALFDIYFYHINQHYKSISIWRYLITKFKHLTTIYHIYYLFNSYLIQYQYKTTTNRQNKLINSCFLKK